MLTWMPISPLRLRRFALRATIISALGFAACNPGGLLANAQESSGTPAAAPEAAAPAVDAAAVDPAAVERGFEVWKGQDCTGCHGWAGNGERIGENPEGPNLRAIEMEPEFLKEVILCGRPGTQMPYHDPQAYTDGRCYGMSKADTEDLTLLEGKRMTSEEADDLVAYMLARMIGRPEEPNQEDCRAYYGNRPFCDRLPTPAEQGL